MAKLDLVEVFKRRTRHPFRPRASDIIDELFRDFKPMNSPGISMVAGTCEFMKKNLFVIGQQKPKPADLKSIEDLSTLNYGMMTSDEHARILRILKEARESDPERTFIFCLIESLVSGCYQFNR